MPKQNITVDSIIKNIIKKYEDELKENTFIIRPIMKLSCHLLQILTKKRFSNIHTKNKYWKNLGNRMTLKEKYDKIIKIFLKVCDTKNNLEGGTEDICQNIN